MDLPHIARQKEQLNKQQEADDLAWARKEVTSLQRAYDRLLSEHTRILTVFRTISDQITRELDA